MLIPTQNPIRAAREKRTDFRAYPEVLQQSKGKGDGEEEYISLAVSTHLAPSAPERESRLVREDDEIGDAEDGEKGLFFSSRHS